MGDISAANTGYMLMSCALVLLMTPGLAFFYGGLVRRKNILNVLAQCFIAMCLVTIEWVVVGFSLAFGTDTHNGFIGDRRDYFMLHHISAAEPWTGLDIPETVFVAFQCMFAVITPALILGSTAERIRFSGFTVFIAIWIIVCYCPLCHWAWGGGYFHGACKGPIMDEGEDAIDFAGGTVVHLNSGIAALILCLRLGRRSTPGASPDQHLDDTPHNLPFAVLGAGLLWFGWFGFNAGSALAANASASSAFFVTHVATAAGGLMWALIDTIRRGKTGTLGLITGAVCGLVAITPACGDVDNVGAIINGAGGAVVSYFMCHVVKESLKYDDTLDVWGVHGTSGVWGCISVGFLTVNKNADGEPLAGQHQVWVQAKSCMACIAWTGTMTFIIIEIVDRTIGMLASPQEQQMGMDMADFGEQGYGDQTGTLTPRDDSRTLLMNMTGQSTPSMTITFNIPGQGIVSHKFTQRPLGLELSKNIPIVVKAVSGGSEAELHRVPPGSQLVAINGEDMQTRNFEYVYEKMSMGAAMLPMMGQSNFGAMFGNLLPSFGGQGPMQSNNGLIFTTGSSLGTMTPQLVSQGMMSSNGQHGQPMYATVMK